MKGLNNIGNTCYLNSALQMLLLNSSFCNLILNYNNGKSEILNILSNFIINYHMCKNHMCKNHMCKNHSCKENNNKSITPDDIKNIIQNKYKMFNGNQQHDSNELICCLFDIINEEITNYYSPYHYNLYTIFGFNLESRIKCKLINCLDKSITSNKELILNLNVKKNLEESFNDFFSKEVLSNQYTCNKCNIKSIASKRLNIKTYPNNLLICLKRFNFINSCCNKINDQEQIPLIIELSSNIYKLHGAIIHSGSYNGGHYIYVGLVENIWYLFNDNHVSELRTNINDELLNSYLLYYKLI